MSVTHHLLMILNDLEHRFYLYGKSPAKSLINLINDDFSILHRVYAALSLYSIAYAA